MENKLPRRSLLKQFKYCRKHGHKIETRIISEGHTWMDDSYSYKVCSVCGKVESCIKVY